MNIGKLIKELRTKKGMTQEELADKTELSARTIQRIENGEVDPRAYTLQLIAKALDVEFSLFVEDDSVRNQESQDLGGNSWLALLYLSGIIPLILPSVFIWNLKKDKIKERAGHYRAIISFQLMIIGVILGCLWVYWQVNQLKPLWGVLLMNALFSITNTIKIMSGDARINMPFFKSEDKKEN